MGRCGIPHRSYCNEMGDVLLNMKWSNKALHATATVLCAVASAGMHSIVVAVASALPVAVRELGR